MGNAFAAILGIVLALLIVGLQIWGVVSASKTEHVDIKTGRLLLHLFLWGFFVAAIIYAVKINGNIQREFMRRLQKNT